MNTVHTISSNRGGSRARRHRRVVPDAQVRRRQVADRRRSRFSRVGSGIVRVIASVLHRPHHSALRPVSPDVRLYSSANDVRDFLSGCGAAGREAYQNLQIADLFYPAICGVFLAVALALTLCRLSRADSPVVALAAIPLVAAVFDYLENAVAWIALTRYPADPGMAAELIGVASVAKQVFSWASWLLLVCTIGLVTVRFAQRRLHGTDPAVTAPSGLR